MSTPYMTPEGSIRLMLPVFMNDENHPERNVQFEAAATHLAKFGLAYFAVMEYETGTILGHAIHKQAETRYTRALDEVKAEEILRLMPAGTTETVLSLILAEEFDSSDWALWYGVEQFQGTGIWISSNEQEVDKNT